MLRERVEAVEERILCACERAGRPRLVLIAPALSFHPKTETILRYFLPEIEVERIGLGVEWRQEPRVMFRVRGARRPI